MLDLEEAESYEVSARKLRAVGGGLRLVYAGILLSILAMLGMFLGMFGMMAGMQPGAGMPPGAGPAPPRLRDLELLVTGVGYVFLFAALLQVYGRWQCRNLPRGLNAAAALRTTLAVDFWTVGLMAWNHLAGLAAQFGLGAGGGPPDWLASKIQFAALVAPVFFLMFLGGVARYVDRPDLAARAKWILIWGFVCVGCIAAIIGYAAMMAAKGFQPGMAPNANVDPGPPAVAMLVGLASLFLIVAAPITALRYLFLIKQLPGAALAYAERLDDAALHPPAASRQ